MKPVGSGMQEDGKARITVEVFEADYQALRLAAARAGRGASVSRLVRELVHEWVEQAEDQADIALAEQREAEAPQQWTGQQVRAWLEERRQSRIEAAA